MGRKDMGDSLFRYGFVALLLLAGGCSMLGMEKENAQMRHVPLLNPGAAGMLAQKGVAAGGYAGNVGPGYAAEIPQPAAPAQGGEYGGEDIAGGNDADTGFFSYISHIGDSLSESLSSASEEVSGWFSASGGGSGHDNANKPAAGGDAGGVRYTPVENVIALQQGGNYDPFVAGYDDAADNTYASLSSVPQTPSYEDTAQTRRKLNRLESERIKAERLRQQMVADDNIEEQMKSARLSGFVTAPADNDGIPPRTHADNNADTSSDDVATGNRRRMINQEWGTDTEQEIYAPVSGNMPLPQPLAQGQRPPVSAPAVPVEEPTMDAYTAEILGERILPLEDTHITANTHAATASTATAPGANTPATPAPAYTPPVANAAKPLPLEVTEVSALPEEYAEAEYPEDNSPSAGGYTDGSHGQNYGQNYSYYEEAAPALRAPAPIARQTIFLPESRYARRRLGQ